VAADFERELSAFQAWANTQAPEFAAGVNAIISNAYLANLGAGEIENKIKAPVPVNPQVNVADKITSFIDTVGGAYLKSVDAYYTAKGKAADLQLKAQGSAVTQTYNTATAIPNWVYLAGAGVLAVVLLRRR
jgi:hypothetical protein